MTQEAEVSEASAPDSSLDKKKHAELLARVAFFEGISERGLLLFSEVTKAESYGLGEQIFSFGDPGDKLYIIVDGKVRISRDVAGLGEEALAVLGPGEVFGEMSLLDESPRSAGAKAHERCRLLTVTKSDFDDLLFLHKSLAFEVLWTCVKVLSARLRETNEKLTFLSASGKF